MAEQEERLAGIGHNFPPLARSIAATEGDFAEITTAFLADEYAKQPKIVDSLLAEASALMRDAEGNLKKIEDDDVKGKVASLIKRMRDAAKALEAFHDKEKQAYLRGGQAVDQFFFGLIDKLAKRAKPNRSGAADILNQLLTDYDNRKLAEEQARRQREAEEAARILREAQKREEQERQKAEEARLAAERARSPERAEEKAQIAEQQEAKADEAAVNTQVAAAKAEETRIETLRKPADIMRTRGDDGTLSTLSQEKYAEIVDRTQLNMAQLGPYFSIQALQQALNAWARATDYRQEMPGASVGRRNKSNVR